MEQFIVTPAMGKRLIGRALAAHPTIQTVLTHGTLVIIAGTTNGYVAEEILSKLGQGDGFSRQGFRRGLIVPPGCSVPAQAGAFPGDVVLVRGQWQRGKTIFDMADGLKAGDVILKGANALDLRRGQAAVLIADPQCGTSAPAIRAVVGRRVEMIVPVGLEKRVSEDIADLAELANSPTGVGPRLLPLPGKVFTELDAVAVLTGATARLLSAGGVYGAEGALWLAVTGTAEQVQAAGALIRSLANEPPCQV